MIDGLSILLKLAALGLLLSLVLVYLPLPAATHGPLLVIWKTLQYRPGIIIALRRRASDAFSHDRFETAIQFSREALQRGLLGPLSDLPFDVLTIAVFLQRSGQLDASAEWFILADDSTRDDFHLKPLILIGLGSCLTQLGRYDQAELFLERAFLLYNDIGLKHWRDLINARGYLATISGRFEDARRWYENLESLPKGTRDQRLANLNNLATVSVALGDLAKAERYIDEALSVRGTAPWPDEFHLINTRGCLRLAQGRLSEARAEFNQALTLRGAEPRTFLFLAQTAYKRGSFEEAIDYINRMPKPPCEPLWRRELADTLESLAEFDALSGRPEVAEGRRAEASKLRTEVASPGPPNGDPMLDTVRSTLAGRRFTRMSGFEVLAARAYLAAFLLVVGSILFLPDPSAAVVILEAALLAFFVATRWPLDRWLLWARTVSGQ